MYEFLPSVWLCQSLIGIPILGLISLIIYCEINPYRGGISINKEALEKKRRRNKDPGYPCGWFRIADVDEVPINSLIERSICGKDYILTKTNSKTSTGPLESKISVFEPYCPHNGTDLSKNSFIRDGQIVCQFHEWEFGCKDGVCNKIPYGDDESNESIKSHSGLKSPEFRIWKGCVLIWYHPQNEKSTWDLTDENNEFKNHTNFDDLKCLGIVDHHLACLVDDIHENSADLAHFQFLHKTNLTPFMTSSWENYSWKANKHIGTGTIDHYLSFFGWKWLSSSTTWYNIGPGIIMINAYFPSIGKVIIIDTTTPRDVFHTERNLVIYGSWSISRLMFRYPCWFFYYITMQDNVIWNWKKTPQNPLYTKNEHELAKFRRWFRKFYVSPKSIEYEN